MNSGPLVKTDRGLERFEITYIFTQRIQLNPTGPQ
jgi:hypothetical protein